MSRAGLKGRSGTPRVPQDMVVGPRECSLEGRNIQVHTTHYTLRRKAQMIPQMFLRGKLLIPRHLLGHKFQVEPGNSPRVLKTPFANYMFPLDTSA